MHEYRSIHQKYQLTIRASANQFASVKVTLPSSSTGMANSSVSNVTYVGNTATGAQDYGVIIDQVCADRRLCWCASLTARAELPVDARDARERGHHLRT